MRSVCGLLLVACTAAPAWATETPKYEPTPSWVLPAPPVTEGAAPLPLVAVLDEQTRIAEDTVWTYREIGARALSADALARMGTLTLDWQPYHGDLIVHRVDIVRDGQHIDVLKAGQKFSVIRREQGLEELEMNGILTATLQVEGLRMGDILDVAYSVSVNDPALKGAVQATAIAMPQPFKVGFARTRIIWPDASPIRWKAYPLGLKAAESDKGGWHELSFALPAPKQPDTPADAPRRFSQSPRSMRPVSAAGRRFPPCSRPSTELKGSSLQGPCSRRPSRKSAPKRRTPNGGRQLRYRWSRTASGILRMG